MNGCDCNDCKRLREEILREYSKPHGTVTMVPIRMVVVESTTRPGSLSLRARVGDATASPIYLALNQSGAKVGDELELRLIRRPTSVVES